MPSDDLLLGWLRVGCETRVTNPEIALDAWGRIGEPFAITAWNAPDRNWALA